MKEKNTQLLKVNYWIVPILAVTFAALRIEQKVGYYECRHCNHRYVPTYLQVFLAMHVGWIRYMKCPECGRRSWQRKIWTKKGRK